MELGVTRRRLEDRSTFLQAAAVAGAGADVVTDASVRSRLNGRIATGLWQRIRTRRNPAPVSGSEHSIAGDGDRAATAADVSVRSRFNEGAIKRTSSYVISIIGEY